MGSLGCICKGSRGNDSTGGGVGNALGTTAVCGRGASVQTINVNQIAQVASPASRPTTLIGRPPNCNTFYILQISLYRQRESAHWHLKKSPAECGAGVRGRGLAYLALFG